MLLYSGGMLIVRDSSLAQMEKWQDLELLDGSPPCTVFSVMGKREEDWGVKRKFSEGQSEQILDTLFMSYLRVVESCRPKVFVAENVEGMARGAARGYVREVIAQARILGYRVTVVSAKAGWYGVPQIRGRLFFVGVRDDVSQREFTLPIPTGQPVTVRQAFEGLDIPEGEKSWLNESSQAYAKWKVNPCGGYGFSRGGNRMHEGFFARLSDDWTPKAIGASGQISHPHEPRWLHPREFARLATFADDYRFVHNQTTYARYVTGMSVPPFLMEAVSRRVRELYL